jgi:Ca-activated chloride channel family protein
MVLRGVDVNSVRRGGTRIGEALRKAIKGFPAGQGAKLIVLITDGEDHESFPSEAAKEVLAAGIRVVAIGFGSEEGSQLLVTDPKSGVKAPVLDKNNVPVVSRLDGELLREIAITTEGAYVPAGTSALDLDSIIAEHVQPIVREQADATVRVVPAERYPWFVLASLVALVMAAWVGADPARRHR